MSTNGCGYVGTRSIRQALSYFDANAGFIPGAGANGRPYFVLYGANVSRNLFIPMATNAMMLGLNPNIAWYSGLPFIATADGSSLNAPSNTPPAIRQVADQINANVARLGGVGLGLPYYLVRSFTSVSLLS